MTVSVHTAPWFVNEMLCEKLIPQNFTLYIGDGEINIRVYVHQVSYQINFPDFTNNSLVPL